MTEAHFIHTVFGLILAAVMAVLTRNASLWMKFVCQYTGLTDRNGVKIWEGDIIKGANKLPYVIRWGNGVASFVADGGIKKMLPCMNEGTMQYYEVVGNIWDNPELLEGGTGEDD